MNQAKSIDAQATAIAYYKEMNANLLALVELQGNEVHANQTRVAAQTLRAESAPTATANAENLTRAAQTTTGAAAIQGRNSIGNWYR